LKEKQDDGLYLLNLGMSFYLPLSSIYFTLFQVSREWTRVSVHGPGPLGRYGHAVTMASSKFILFGGQVDGEFLNDVWSFDLNSRKPHLIYSISQSHSFPQSAQRHYGNFWSPSPAKCLREERVISV
jgi:hypothetical protein